MLLFSHLCVFPADAFVDFLRLRHHRAWRCGGRQSSYRVERPTSTQPEVWNELEGEKISTSYKIVAGLDPEWFDRFVMTPLGNTEFIEGQSVEQIVQEGKSVSIEWMEKQRKKDPSINDMGETELGKDDTAVVAVKKDVKKVDDVRIDDSAIPNTSDESSNVTTIVSKAEIYSFNTAKDVSFDSRASEIVTNERTEKEKIETDTKAASLDSLEKAAKKNSEKGTVVKSDLSKGLRLNFEDVEVEMVDTFDKDAAKAGVARRDDLDTALPERVDEKPPVKQKESRENATSAAETFNTGLSLGDFDDKRRVKIETPDAARFETPDPVETPRNDDSAPSQPETIILSKGGESESLKEKEHIVLDNPDGMPTKSPNMTSSYDRPSFEQKPLDQKVSSDTRDTSSSKKFGDSDRSTKVKSREDNKDKSSPKAASSFQESFGQIKPSASDVGTTQKEKRSKVTDASTEKSTVEKGAGVMPRETVKEKQELNQKEPSGSKADTSLSDGPSNDEEKATVSSDRVVVYKGLYSRPWKQVPLEKLISLGYTEDAITALIPDTLELIAAENIKIPSSGIPSRWKRKESSQAIVKVVSADEAEALLTSAEPKETSKETAGAEAKNSKSTRESKGMEEKGFPSRSERSNTRGQRYLEKGSSSRRERKEPPPTEDRRRRRRDRVSTLEDGSPKPVYSGRPPAKSIASRRRGDPPSPGSFWPDMDTFRNLLRNEAELRLRILGDGFEDSVKQETMWRHNLYSDWLWTLKNGVGNPIVESRSDRYRRLREQARLEESRDLRKRRERRKQDDE